MKKIKLSILSLFIVAALVSCDKDKIDEGFKVTINPTLDLVAVIGENQGGNLDCSEVNAAILCDLEWTSGRLNYEEYPTGSIVGPITWTTDGTYVSLNSTEPVRIAIIVKGGNGANVYFSGCDNECVTQGSGFSAPVNPVNGKPYGLSNVTFCYTICDGDDQGDDEGDDEGDDDGDDDEGDDDTEESCETAFALKSWLPMTYCFIDHGFNRWGWTNGPITDAHAKSTYYLYAGAAQCNATEERKVGKVEIFYVDGTARVELSMYGGYTLSETHLYIGNEMFPKDNSGENTVAPGLYPYKHENLMGAKTDTYIVSGLSGNLYVIAHAVVCGEFPKED